MNYFCFFVFLGVFGTCLSYSGFIPKSYYVIDKDGHKSDTVYIRNRRSLEPLLAHLRQRRSGVSGSGSGSYSSSSSSSYSGSNGGSNGGSSGGAPLYYGNQYGIPGGSSLEEQGFATNLQQLHNLASNLAQGGGAAPGPDIFSRGNFGSEEAGPGGVSYSGQAQGAKGVYSASSSSIDSNGKVTYTAKGGKF